MVNPFRKSPPLRQRRCTNLLRLLQIFSIAGVGYNALHMCRRLVSDDESYLSQLDLDEDPGVFVKGNDHQSHNYKHEVNVFQKLIDRFGSVNDICHAMPSMRKEEAVRDFDTGVPPLPKNGMYVVLQDWIRSEDGANDDTRAYPMCELPPATSCKTASYSVVLMSHTVSDQGRLNKMIGGIEDLSSRPRTSEIILVWNADKDVLISSEKRAAKKLIEWDQNTSHPLRIFYSLDNGLENNLLNRYHPSIQPAEEVVMYFDDDGPFFSDDVMLAGLELWKLHADTQVGCFPRNIRSTSERMQLLQKKATTNAMELFLGNATETYMSPYNMPDSLLNKQPEFTPICNKETGDEVEYNFNVFPHFQANMFLPSGTFLHRNFLCYIWHPAFEELRQYILDHPTHPDDMMVSTLVSHLSGKVLRTFPRRIKKSTPDPNTRKLKRKYTSVNQVDQNLDSNHRRKLLWEQKNWADMREEGLNSILNYFGSLNPGSLGWCVGTKYYVEKKNNKDNHFACDPEFPNIEQLPWMNPRDSAYNYCN